MEEVVLAIDQGTTSVRASLLDAKLRTKTSASRTVARAFPQPGWVELDAKAVVHATEQAVHDALQRAGERRVIALGLANQGESVVVWDRKTGEPIAPAIGWQCRRTEDDAAELRKTGIEPEVKRRTGLPIDPYFSATKIAWLLDHVDGARDRANRGELLAGTLDTYTLHRWSSGKLFVTDPSTACRTLLAPLATGEFDDELCHVFDVPRGILATVVASDAHPGEVSVAGTKLPVRALLCDQPAALLGVGCLRPFDAKCTYGTGAFVQIMTGDRWTSNDDGLLRSIAFRIGGKTDYLLEGSVLAAGDVLTWLRDDLRMLVSFDEVEEILRATPDSGGVAFVPALAGLGAPRWQGEVRGAIVGMSRATRREHVVRAALEGIAHQVADILDAAPEIATVWADGGLALSDAFVELSADVAGRTFARPAELEATTRGIAAVAALSSGLVSALEEAVTPRDAQTFAPTLSVAARDRARAKHHALLDLLVEARHEFGGDP